MKKIVSILLCVFILVGTTSGYAYGKEESIDLESIAAILMDSSTGKILYQSNVHEKRAPASVTKLMTLMISLEAIEKGYGTMEDVVVTSEYANSLGGSQIYLAVGERMSLQDLLYAIAVGSANDACVAVAEHLYGTETAFVDAMNAKASEIGMKNTHFVNPYGLPDEQHYTTAYDLALLAKAAVQKQSLLELTSTKHYTLRKETKNPFELYNTNKLLWWYDGTQGLKTGWIGTESGYNLAAMVDKENMQLICIILGAEKQHGNFRDAMKLFDYGYHNYQYVNLYASKQEITTIEVQKGKKQLLSIGTNEKVGHIIPKIGKIKLDYTIEIANPIVAPISKDTKVGIIRVINQQEVLASYDLVALENIEKSTFPQMYYKVLRTILR